jgi:glycosyltransferase involved in cell wall biosynthesis
MSNAPRDVGPSTDSPRMLSVVIPAYNEEKTILRVIREVLQGPHLLEVIVVDDCSTDRTFDYASQVAAVNPVVRVIRQQKNGGKTSALKAGFAYSTGEIVIVQDADLEYRPSEIHTVIEPILDGFADVVFGSRFQVRRAARVLYFYHYLANKALTFLSDLFTNLNLTDVETGYKAFKGEIIRNMVITSSGFGFEIEVIAKIAKLRCAVFEVPISYYGRTYAEGKKIGVLDGVAALWYILYYNLLVSLRRSYRTVPNLAPQFRDGIADARSKSTSSSL